MKQSIENRLEAKREKYGEDCQAILEILENGENHDNGNRNSLFYNEEVMPNSIVKIFYGENPRDVRNKIENTHEDYFPDAEVRVCDTRDISNPELFVKEEKTVLVVEDKSNRTILDSEDDYETMMERATRFVDNLVREGQIIDDFKLEEIHEYDEGLKYVDFEDKKAIKNWPLLTDPSTVKEVTTKMAEMYGQLAADLTKNYKKTLRSKIQDPTLDEDRIEPIEYVKEDIAEKSEEIDNKIYDKKGFTPKMVGSWTYKK